MNKFRQAGADDSLWWLLLAFLVACGILAALFAVVPYLWIFLIANFFFIYVTVVYLLKYWENKPLGTSTRKPQVSIIVPAYKVGSTIERCLESLLALEYPTKPQIIVIDDASPDDTAAKLRKFSRQITIIRNKVNIGKAASLNKAIPMCKGEIVACIDADTFPEKRALSEMVRHFSDEKVGAVVALVCVDRPKNFLQKLQEIEYYVAFGFWHTALSRLDGLLVTPGPMSLYRKSALVKIHGFDEDNITEDMEIALHLQDEGYAIRCTTDAKIYTVVPDNFRALYRQRLRWLRGKIFNGVHYSHMLFNSKYGDFGKFVYPISFFLEIMGVVVVARVLAMHAFNALNMGLGVLRVAQLDPAMLSNFGIYSDAALNSSSVFFIITILMWSYIVLVAFKMARERIKLSQVIPLIFFMTIYSMFTSLVYFSSILHEAVGAKRRW